MCYVHWRDRPPGFWSQNENLLSNGLGGHPLKRDPYSDIGIVFIIISPYLIDHIHTFPCTSPRRKLWCLSSNGKKVRYSSNKNYGSKELFSTRNGAILGKGEGSRGSPSYSDRSKCPFATILCV